MYGFEGDAASVLKKLACAQGIRNDIPNPECKKESPESFTAAAR
jgi:hypothetical protein